MSNDLTENFLKKIDQVLEKVGCKTRVLPFDTKQRSVFQRLPRYLTKQEAQALIDSLGNVTCPYWFVTYLGENLLEIVAGNM